MLRNLLSNAIRYTDHGRIVLGCRRAGAGIRIEVWDSGVGIAGDQLPHIFDEYYQGPEGSRRGGFGLGLAIVRRLAELLEHKVDVRSVPGKGTGFFIEVPLGQSVPIATELATASVGRDILQVGGTALIIEDETSVRASLRRLLKAIGMDVVEAANGNEAVLRITRDGVYPDLLLSDFNLPGVNGVDSIKAVCAAATRKIPAILMTGDVRSETVEAIGAQGMFVLIKPFSADELFQQIQRAWPRLNNAPAPGV
jgi:CheY-like chemotaxis protein